MTENTTRSFALVTAIVLALAAAGCTGESGAADIDPSQLTTAEFEVDGMTCSGCAIAAERAVKKLDGVALAEAGYDGSTKEGRCTVQFDPAAVSVEEIAAAIEDVGFRPTLTSTSEGG